MAKPGEYLLIEDTTSLDFSTRHATEGLGRTGDDHGRGFFLHSSLAFRMVNEETEMIGLYRQQAWARGDDFHCEGSSRSERLSRERESQRWGRLEPLAPGVRATFVADREADIYECLRDCAAAGFGYVIRACQDRALLDEQGRPLGTQLFDAVADAPVLGEILVELRSRPGKKARQATLEVRSTRLTIRAPWRPGQRGEPIELTVVEAMEKGKPRNRNGRRKGRQNDKPLHWVLLTDRHVDTFEQARRVVENYRRRWLVEEYFKALKTGCGVEESQMRTAKRLLALTGVLSVVATRLLGMKLLARSRQDEPIPPDVLGPYGLRILSARKQALRTWRDLIRAIAGLGGFQGRKSDGEPGWITIWRGFQKLWGQIQGAEAVLQTSDKCGE